MLITQVSLPQFSRDPSGAMVERRSHDGEVAGSNPAYSLVEFHGLREEISQVKCFAL